MIVMAFVDEDESHFWVVTKLVDDALLASIDWLSRPDIVVLARDLDGYSGPSRGDRSGAQRLTVAIRSRGRGA